MGLEVIKNNDKDNSHDSVEIIEEDRLDMQNLPCEDLMGSQESTKHDFSQESTKANSGRENALVIFGQESASVNFSQESAQQLSRQESASIFSSQESTKDNFENNLCFISQKSSTEHNNNSKSTSEGIVIPSTYIILEAGLTLLGQSGITSSEPHSQ